MVKSRGTMCNISVTFHVWVIPNHRKMLFACLWCLLVLLDITTLGFAQKTHYKVMNLKKYQCKSQVMMTVEIRKFAYSNLNSLPSLNRWKWNDYYSPGPWIWCICTYQTPYKIKRFTQIIVVSILLGIAKLSKFVKSLWKNIHTCLYNNNCTGTADTAAPWPSY